MLQWTVEGARKSDGCEVAIPVEALTEDEARADASRRGIVVGKIRRAVGERAPIDYRDAPISSSAMTTKQTPSFTEIVAGASVLSGLAVLSGVIAYICFGLAALMLVGGVLGMFFGNPLGLAVMIYALAPAGYGVLMLIVAAVLRMLGAIGLAVREIAINSGKHQAPERNR